MGSGSSIHLFSVPLVGGVPFFKYGGDTIVFKPIQMFLFPKKINFTASYEFFVETKPPSAILVSLTRRWVSDGAFTRI
jgi:hypothetical protein